MKKPINIVLSITLLVAAIIGWYFIFKDTKSALIPGPILVSTSTLPSLGGVSSSTPTTFTTTTISPSQPEPIQPYGSITLRVGDFARYAAGTIHITDVVQDSRCPVDVQCIQAGTVELAATVSYSSLYSKDIRLELGSTTVVEGVSITLVSVNPTKNSKITLTPKDYAFTLRVEKAGSASIKPCMVGGCSGEICSDKEGVVSTCIYKQEFACYKTATCTRQSTGSCGWTQTPELTACLSDKGTL